MQSQSFRSLLAETINEAIKTNTINEIYLSDGSVIKNGQYEIFKDYIKFMTDEHFVCPLSAILKITFK